MSENRRGFMKKIATASIVGIGAVGTAGATPSNTDGTDVRVVRDPNGVSRKDVEDIQNDVISQASTSGTSVRGVPEYNNNNKLLAYATKIVPSGNPLSYTLYFSNSKRNKNKKGRISSKRKPNRNETQEAINDSELDEYLDSMKDSSSVRKFKQSLGHEKKYGGVKSQSMDVEWDFAGNHACDTTDGDNELVMDNDVFKSEDGSYSNKNRWAISTVSTANPAVNRTNNWFADELGEKRVIHNWPAGDLTSANPGVVDVAPSGNEDGEVKATTYDFGVADGSPSIGVSTTYEQTSKENREDLTDSAGHEDEAGWEWNYDDEAEYRSEHETMSVSYLEEMSQSDPVVAKVKIRGEFASLATPTVSIPEASLKLEATEL